MHKIRSFVPLGPQIAWPAEIVCNMFVTPGRVSHCCRKVIDATATRVSATIGSCNRHLRGVHAIAGTDGSLCGYGKTIGMSPSLRLHSNSSPSVRKVQNERLKPSQFIIEICRSQLASVWHITIMTLICGAYTPHLTTSPGTVIEQPSSHASSVSIFVCIYNLYVHGCQLWRHSIGKWSALIGLSSVHI